MSAKHCFNDLLGMRIRFADGTDGDRVIDVRLSPSARVTGPLAELVVDGLVSGTMRPGTLFGYDRRRRQGPWLIRTIVRALHRHTGYLDWSDVERIDWDARMVHVRTTGLRDLTDVTDGDD